ncbi:unnamed protein product [Jaminaea pallidilutea]
MRSSYLLKSDKIERTGRDSQWDIRRQGRRLYVVQYYFVHHVVGPRMQWSHSAARQPRPTRAAQWGSNLNRRTRRAGAIHGHGDCLSPAMVNT